MSNQPPVQNGPPSQGGGSMRIGPFWKRAAELSPMGDEPFDALTDLFLGEVGAGRGKAAATAAGAKGGAKSARHTPPAAPTDGPMLRLAGAETDDEYQLAPAPTTPVAAVNGMFPTLTASPVLTLDEEDEGEARPIAVLPPPARNPVLELLVLSNLPVLAGAWASQYVREIAEAAGKPVAYLRMQGAFVSLEIVGALADVSGAPRPEDLGSLEAAIDAAAEFTDRWIVRCDAGQEASVIASSITLAVTVLTGTDQTARAACEKTLGTLVARLPAPEADGPMVRLAMMGSGTEQSKAAGADFAAMATAMLARPVATIACAGKIGGVRPAHPLFGGQTELTLGTLIKSVERALVAEPVGDQMFGAGTAAVVEPVRVASVSPIEDVRDEVEEFVEFAPAAVSEMETRVSADELASLADVGSAAVEMAMAMAEMPLPEPKPTMAEIAAGYTAAMREPMRRVEVAAAAADEAQTAPHPHPHPPTPATAHTHIESGHVGVWDQVRIDTDAFVPASRAEELPLSSGRSSELSSGLVSLASYLADLHSTALKCPYAEGIEIAVDAAGALHLLARSHSETTDDAALAGLLVASSWTESHGALLGPAVGAMKPGRPTLHLFTDRPKATRRLLETNLRVHLLAEVSVGDERGWYFADLN